MHNTPPSQLPPQASRNSSTQFAYISARTLRRVQASARRTSTSLQAECLKPLSSKQLRADRPGLFIAACRPHRGTARAKRALTGRKNDCCISALLQFEHLFRSSKNTRFLDPHSYKNWQTSCKVLQPMSRLTNDRAAITCKSPRRRANTKTCMTLRRDSPHVPFSKLPVRHGPRQASKQTL
jgi:hypothetical protein